MTPESASGPIITPRDRWWIAGFVVSLLVLWVWNFLLGMSVPEIGYGICFTVGSFCFLLPVFLLFTVVLAPFSPSRNDRRPKQAACRAALGVAGIGLGWFLLTLNGGPVTLGGLCAARWGIDLVALREFHESEAVMAAGREKEGRFFAEAEIPSSVRSRFWGTPLVYVEPGTGGAPRLIMSWNSGLFDWAIEVNRAGKSSHSEDTHLIIQLADDVWLFRIYGGH
jgi:hypothetical protein